MDTRTRENQLVHAFVTLADSLVADYDIVDVLQGLVEECTSLFEAAAGGILLVNGVGELEVIVSTDERSEVLGLMQLRNGEGPCVEAIRTAQVVSVMDLQAIGDRWPVFAEACDSAGFVGVHAIPMRLRQATIGSLNLFRTMPGDLNEPDAVAAQALADVATISILQERAHRETDLTQQQLQYALDSRVVIEQAKGYLAHTTGMTMDQAFARIRAHARTTQTRLRDVAGAIVRGELEL